VRAAQLALEAFDYPLDRFLDYALWQTFRELAPHWLPALREGKFDFGKRTHALVFALKAVGTPDTVKPLAELISSGKTPPEEEEAALKLIATLGGPADLRLMLDRVLGGKDPAARRVMLLAALGEATQRRGVRPSGDLEPVVALTATGDLTLRMAALRLVGRWKLEPARPALTAAASDGDAPDALRRAAIDGLAALGGDRSRDALDRISAEGLIATRRAATIALAGLAPEKAAARTAQLLASADGGDPLPLFEAMIHQKHGGVALARALEKTKLAPDVAKVGIRVTKSSGRESAELVEALRNAGGLRQTGPRVLDAVAMRAAVDEVARRGDATRGEVVFRRKELSCLKCHAIAGCGGQVGPDLSSIGASAQVDYLIDSLLVPNKAVKEGYHSTLVTTSAGKLYSGVKIRQTASELVLRSADDAEIVIPLKDVEEQSQGGSLMPDGLADELTTAEFVDLIRFLSELGKVGPYSVSKSRLVRRWQALEPNAAAQESLGSGGLIGVVQDPGLIWTPAYSAVSGVLPAEDIPPGPRGLSLVRFQVEATAAGKAALRFNGAQGLNLWLDRTPVEPKELTEMSIPTGTHAVTIAFDRRQRPAGLRVELADVAGSPARVRLVGGK
jgi:putative heme-binding domain-containing protein